MNPLEFDGSVVPIEVDGDGGDLLILAHGAGGSMTAKTILHLRDEFVARGKRVARFNFLYKVRGGSMPDRMPKLMETYRAVANHLRAEIRPERLFCAGHSMGGRTASMIASEGFPMDGLALMAYPLHPAGQPTKLRVEHLAAITMPVICLNGTRDELCTRELMDELRPQTPNWTMHWLEGADHGYKAPKSSGDVLGQIGDAVVAWMDGLP